MRGAGPSNLAGGCFGTLLMVFGISVSAMRVLFVVGVVLGVVGGLMLFASFVSVARSQLCGAAPVDVQPAHCRTGDHVAYTGGGRYTGDVDISGVLQGEGGRLLVGDEGHVVVTLPDIYSLRCQFPEVQVSLMPEDVARLDSCPVEDLQTWSPGRHSRYSLCFRKVVRLLFFVSSRYSTPTVPHDLWLDVVRYLAPRHVRSRGKDGHCVPWCKLGSAPATDYDMPSHAPGCRQAQSC